MTATARALVLGAPRALEAQDLPLPEISDDDALLRVEACGLCGTDHEQYTGALPFGKPFIPGHETVGVIEEIGADASKKWGVRKGDRVAVEVYQSCGSCSRCLVGEYRFCEKHGLDDMYGFTPVTVEPRLWGGYAEWQYLSPDSLLHKVPDSISPELATLFNPIGAGVRWGATLPEVEENETVVIMGPGIRGLSALAAAIEAGAGFAMVTGVGANDAPRLEMADRFGADLTVDVSTGDPVGALKSATGGLADVVIDVTAKAPSALAQAIGFARPGGRIVIAGTRGSGETPGFWPDLIVYKELTLMGALGVDSPAYIKAFELLASGKYPFDELPRKVVGLDGAEDLLLEMAGETDSPPPVHGVLKP